MTVRPIDQVLAEIEHNPQGVTHLDLIDRLGYQPLPLALMVATLESTGKVFTTRQRVYPKRADG